MSELIEISKLQNLSDVAHYLGCKPQSLAYTLYHEKNKYTTFEIKKKNGGVRLINSPCDKLKVLQRILANKLSECLDEIYKENGGNKISHGFVKNKTIITNASEHRNKNLVFNIDLTDFFNTINFGRVRGFFIKNNNFMLNEKVATIFAQIACHDGKLPQGSPCSPVISNLILNILDIRLAKLAFSSNCYYTRYADDLTFSTNKKVFSKNIVKYRDDGAPESGPLLTKEISRSGFIINDKKTRLQFCDSRQDVTGLIVNKVVNIPSDYRRLIKAMTHELFCKNSYYIKNANKKDQKGNLEQLNGMLSYIYSVRKNTIHKNITTRDSKGNPRLDANEKIYSDFLFYRYFVANDKPILICEGKTDVAYIKYAIRSRSSRYNSLVEEEYGEKKLKIQVLNSSGQVNHLLDLLNGTSSIKKFIENYSARLKKYEKPLFTNPVIILTDNDDGSSKLVPAIKGKYRGSKEINGFHFITNNLFLIKTPLFTDKPDSKIEDFFTKELLSRKLNGKTFHPDNDTDNTIHYSKNIFVEEIIRKEYKSIDFSGFDEILDLIVSVIDEYKK